MVSGAGDMRQADFGVKGAHRRTMEARTARRLKGKLIFITTCLLNGNRLTAKKV